MRVKSKKRWACTKCGHIHPGQNPPLKCPECDGVKDDYEYRRLTREDYKKLGLPRKKAPNQADVIIVGSGVSAFVSAVVVSFCGANIIMLEQGKTIGGKDYDAVGFSDKEKAAAFEGIKKLEQGALIGGDEVSEYGRKAMNMLEFLAEEELLPEFKEQKHDPFGNAHPWQQFAESTPLEHGAHNSNDTKHSLHYSLAHFATDNEIRMLVNQQIVDVAINDDGEADGVEVLFNEKKRRYTANLGVVVFLTEDIKLESDNLESGDGLHIINLEDRKPTKAEEEFWGKDSKVGPAMTEAYLAGLQIINKYEEQMLNA